MAKCDEGYRCDVCGQDVEQITDSHLYLSYVIGELDPELLHTSRERHLQCHPILAQFIVDDDFPDIEAEPPFGKASLDPEFVQRRERLVTRGYRRLRQIQGSELSILEYPLPEVIAELERRASDG